MFRSFHLGEKDCCISAKIACFTELEFNLVCPRSQPVSLGFLPCYTCFSHVHARLKNARGDLKLINSPQTISAGC